MKECRISATAASTVVEATISTIFWFLTLGVTTRDYFLFLLAPGILVAGTVGAFAATFSRYLLLGGNTRKCSYAVSLAVLSVIAGRVISIFGFPQIEKVEPQIVRLMVGYSVYAGTGILAATTLHLLVFFASRLFHQE